jgi:hypothetical protein
MPSFSEDSIKKWQCSLKKTALRIAMFVTGDVITAYRRSTEYSPQERHELIQFALSESFWSLRRKAAV